MNCCFELMYLYVGIVFRMWNVVLKKGICMLVVDVEIIIACITICKLYFVLLGECVCNVLIIPNHNTKLMM